MAASIQRFQGGDPTFRSGFAQAWRRKGAIFGYAVIAATVGVLLRAIADRLGWLGVLSISFIGIAWSIVTVFVAPVLVMNEIGPWEAVKRSGEIFKQTWGENVIGAFGIGLITFLLFIVSLLPLAVGITLGVHHPSPGVTEISGLPFSMGLLLSIPLFILVAVITSALSGIFRAALYYYATTGQAPEQFNQQLLQETFTAKKARKLFG